MSSFKSLNLNPLILEALAAKGYTKPTPIQEQSISHILNKGDILGIAQTGTGKTAAFSLPILTNLAAQKVKLRPNHMRCLVLTPTRELASQIEDNIKGYGKNLDISSAVIFGGVNPKGQISKMAKGVDVVIATPGRLLDLMNGGHIKFDQLEIFVLDEADRMLDMGFINDVKKIITKIPHKRQTLLFSATMPKDIAELSHKLLKDPKRVEVTPESTTVEKIKQSINYVEKINKPLLLESILQDKSIKFALVFTRTKHGANRVVQHLERAKIAARAIHGNKSQAAREKALSEFKNGRIRVLVATDIAARGIDISSITHVINYNLPDDPKSYVHRIGRTARAGRDGVAISFCEPAELKLLKDIEKCINYKIPVDETHPFHGVPAQIVKKEIVPSEKKEFSGKKPQSRSYRRKRSFSSKSSNSSKKQK